MVTRREVLISGLAAGVTGWFRGADRLFAKSSQPATKVNFDVPAGACDCHVHIFGDPQRYPFFSGRVYTPETASVAELRALHDALHMDRVVVLCSRACTARTTAVRSMPSKRSAPAPAASP